MAQIQSFNFGLQFYFNLLFSSVQVLKFLFSSTSSSTAVKLILLLQVRLTVNENITDGKLIRRG